jgi:alkylation response protein AidB-like acyl-CoA dehydrogenase
MARLFKSAEAARDAARAFGMQVVRPAGIELDRLHDPADVIAAGSPLWRVLRGFREQGFHRCLIPGAFGGCAEKLPPMAWPLMSEQLGYADAGLAISLAVQSMPFVMAVLSPDAEVRNWARAYADDRDAEMIGCWAITEPDHGSDWVLGSTEDGADAKWAPSLRADRVGDEYVLNGQKSAWVSNGTIATHAVLHVGLDASRGMHGAGLAFCPLDLPGISRGKPLDKVGQRPLNQGEIFFSDVQLPRKYMMIGRPGLTALGRFALRFLGTANNETGIIMAGLARAAFDEALAYARDDTRGGRPLLEDQRIRIKLFEMFTRVESTSALAHRASRHFDGAVRRGVVARMLASRPGYAVAGKVIRFFIDNYERLIRLERVRSFMERSAQSERARRNARLDLLGIASKIACSETAFRVASDAMQILGEDGLGPEYPIEKMFRDARASTIEDGANEMLALAGAEGFREPAPRSD